MTLSLLPTNNPQAESIWVDSRYSSPHEILVELYTKPKATSLIAIVALMLPSWRAALKSLLCLAYLCCLTETKFT